MIGGLVYSLISAASFGLLAIFGKFAHKAGFDTSELLTYRFMLASIMFAIYFLFKDLTLFKISLKDFLKAFLAGGVFYLIQSFAFIKSFEYISASTASLILYAYPITVTILSAIFFKTKIDASITISLILIMSGCSLVFYDAFLRQMSLTGIGYAIIAMTVFSFYLIFIQKSIKNINPLTFSFYVILTTAISFIILSNPTKFPPLTPEKIFIALGIALIPTFIAVTLLYIAIERIGSIYVSIFSTIEPIVTITASYILLKENVVILQIIGMISILLGIILPNYKKMVKNV